MLATLANIAEIIAGIAIVFAAVRAWPIFARMERLQAPPPEDLVALEADARILADAMRAGGRDDVPDDARSPADLARTVLDHVFDNGPQLHFELREDGTDTPGMLRLGRARTPFCRLHAAGYHALIDGIVETLDPTAPAGALRIQRNEQTRIQFIDRVNGPRGPAAVLHCFDRVLAELEPETIGMDASRFWSRLTGLLAEYRGLLVLSGLIGSGKAATTYALLNFLAREPSAKLVDVGGMSEIPLPHLIELTLASTGCASLGDLTQRALLLEPSVLSFGLLSSTNAPAAWQTYSHPCLTLGALHARDAASALIEFSRQLPGGLRNLDDPLVFLGQCMTRKLCPDCRREVRLGDGARRRVDEVFEANRVGLPNPPVVDSLHEPVGCANCEDGYVSLLGIQEMLMVDQPMIEALARSADVRTIQGLARAAGMVDLQAEALLEAAAGRISLPELNRLSRLLDQPAFA
ncbi:MAG TPA: ATPase, T2SS/T4P/T4SS family [Pseudomonadales bacterium]|nr:ATPase, T2SS/T4P/T4SS family [Pseudomonadales bacterium]